MAQDSVADTNSRGLGRILLACGLTAPVLRIGVDLVAAASTTGYDLARMSISDLSAVGAQTRWFVLPVDLVTSVLLIAFALGMWRNVESRKSRFLASLVLGNGAFSLMGAFFPFRLGEPMSSTANVLNTVVLGVSVLFLMLAVVVAAITQRGWFRYFSIATFVVFIAGDVWATWNSPFNLAGQRGEFVGVQERVMLYAYLVWVFVLGLRLLRSHGRALSPRQPV